MIRFFVPGIPAPGGSKRAFVNRHTSRVSMVDMGKNNKPWRANVALAASIALGGPMLTGPLGLHLLFVLPRPKGHYGTGRKAGVVKGSAPKYPTTKPDTTKLLRACEDALSGVLFRDDSAIVAQSAYKIYGERPGVWVKVWQCEAEPLEEPDVVRLAAVGEG